MEIYALDADFQKSLLLERFFSAIWHERYVGLGEAEIVVPATTASIAAFAEGKFIHKRGSRIPMQVETQSIEKGTMTLNCKSVENFFNEREFRPDDASELEVTGKVGEAIGSVVENALITMPFGGEDNALPFLVIGALDATGDDINLKFPYGPVYDAVKGAAETNQVGMAVYLNYPTPFSYELEFVTYTGLVRTSDQFENERVRFSQEEDNFTDVKEVSSIAGYKNVVYVIPPEWHTDTDPRVFYAPGFDASVSGFDRRVLVVDASDIAFEDVGSYADAEVEMEQRGKDALANNNFTKVLDGEVIPHPEFQYGTHYLLGDIVELVGQNGVPQKARITEFVHSVDETGEKQYPTVSVID